MGPSRCRGWLAAACVLAAGCATTHGAVRRDASLGVSPSATAAPAAIHLSLTSAGADRWTVHVAASSAARVDLAADFTDWDPVPLVRDAEGDWSVAVHVGPGVHQVAVRLDGGPWRVPAGLASVTDEFGGVAGVLVVPRPGDAGAAPGSPPGEDRR